MNFCCMDLHHRLMPPWQHQRAQMGSGSHLVPQRSGASQEFGMGSRFCIIVVVLVLAAAVSVLCQEYEIRDMSAPEVYQIDYRGPETHSLPPPRRSPAGPRSKPLRNHISEVDVTPVHG